MKHRLIKLVATGLLGAFIVLVVATYISGERLHQDHSFPLTEVLWVRDVHDSFHGPGSDRVQSELKRLQIVGVDIEEQKYPRYVLMNYAEPKAANEPMILLVWTPRANSEE